MDAEIIRFLAEYDPHISTGHQRPRLDVLQNGAYTFEVLDAAARLTPVQKKPIVAMGLRVQGGSYGGTVVENAWFLTSKASIEFFSADLGRLGRPVHRCGKDLPVFSVALPRFLREAVGTTFVGEVLRTPSSTNLGATYTRLRINRVVHLRPAEPADSSTDPNPSR